MATYNPGSDIEDGKEESDYDSDTFLSFSVPTASRFETRENGTDNGGGWRTQVNKRKKVSDGSLADSSFTKLSIDDKLVKIYEQLSTNNNTIRIIEAKQESCEKTINSVKQSTVKATSRIDELEEIVQRQEERIQLLSYVSIDKEARDRRNNVVFYNITEKSKHTSERSLIISFMENELDIDTSDMCIDRAHRIGLLSQEPYKSRSDPKRPLIVRFRDYIDTETVMNKAYMLKDTKFGVDRNYPKEIANARKTLYQSEEAKLARYEKRQVQIRYPAKLFIDGKMVCDMFPNWFKIIGRDRLSEGRARRNKLESRTYSRETIPDEVINEPKLIQNVNKPTRETADRSAVDINKPQRSRDTITADKNKEQSGNKARNLPDKGAIPKSTRDTRTRGHSVPSHKSRNTDKSPNTNSKHNKQSFSGVNTRQESEKPNTERGGATNRQTESDKTVNQSETDLFKENTGKPSVNK